MCLFVWLLLMMLLLNLFQLKINLFLSFFLKIIHLERATTANGVRTAGRVRAGLLQQQYVICSWSFFEGHWHRRNKVQHVIFHLLLLPVSSWLNGSGLSAHHWFFVWANKGVQWTLLRQTTKIFVIINLRPSVRGPLSSRLPSVDVIIMCYCSFGSIL